jgi:hypothetical protein
MAKTQGFGSHPHNIMKGGRKVGAVNAVTAQTKELFKLLLEANMERLQADLDELTAKDRVNALLQIAGFFIPKLRSIDMKVESESKFKPVEITIIGDDEYKEINERLEAKY